MLVNTPDTEEALDDANSLPPDDPLSSTRELPDSVENPYSVEIPDSVDRGVSFLKLIANSSLGTAAAREYRLAGRKEIVEIERAQPGATMSQLSEEERELDLKVATELELRGYTFEAELRYRGALPPDRPAKPLTQLAQLLEAKGRYAQALPLYAHAAQAGEPNALFRLATISHQVGQPLWSRDFTQLGSAALELEHVSKLAGMLHDLNRRRRTADIGGVLTSAVERQGSIDATYALGSMLLTSGRDDLARLAFAAALARGHTLAGISLLDLPGRRRRRSLNEARAYLAQIWHDDFRANARNLRRERPGILTLGGLITSLGTTTAPPSEAISALLKQLRASRRGASQLGQAVSGSLGVGRVTGAENDDDNDNDDPSVGVSPLQPLLLFTRTITSLRGLVRVGFDGASLGLIDEASQRLCSTISDKVINGKLADTKAVIREIWRIGADELADAKQRRLSLPPLAVGAGERVPAAGGIRRFGQAVTKLDGPKRRVLLLAVAGVSRDVITEVMRLDSDRDVHILLHAAVDRLHAGQQGEQFEPELWSQVERCFSTVPDEVKAAFDSLLPEPDGAPTG